MKYEFTLFVAGKGSVKSRDIIARINGHLSERFKNDYTLAVVDVIDSPELAQKEDIFVTPSWVRNSPAPKKKVIGNFSVKQNIVRALETFFK